MRSEENELGRRLRIGLDLEAFTEYLGFKNAPHHQAIYRALQDPKTKRLLVIMPPGHGKSTCVTVNYPIWEVGLDPNLRFIVASHTKDFVASFIREITARLESPEYIAIFGNLKPRRPNKWTQNELIVNRDIILKDPTFTALGTEQATIGRRADRIICDDIVDEDWASSEALRARLRTWFKKELVERLEPDGRLIVVGTRWHFADLYAELLKDDAYEKMVYPAVDEANNVLWEAKWPLEVLLARKQEIGPIMWSAQYLCNPTPIAGAMLKVEWLHYWHPTDEDPAKKIYKLPPREKLRIFQGWDLAISEDPSADWTIGLTLGMSQEGAAYVLDYFRDHIDFPAQVAQVEAQAAAWKPEKIAIEANAYQRALPQWLRRGLLPVVQVKQTKEKTARILGLAPYFENGTIRILKQHEDLIMEYLQFPKGAHDDILDALDLAFKAARSHLAPGAAIFEPPSAYDELLRGRDETRERFLRGTR